MKAVCLDCRQMTGREALHQYLARKLDFPSWYGKNLDGLFDLLSGWGPLSLAVERAEALEGLGDYGQAFLDTLREAAVENPNLSLTISYGAPPCTEESEA